MSIWNSTLSISFSIFGNTYIQTAVVYYAYTAVAYSIYLSYYISFLTVYFANEALLNDNKTTIITSVCVVVAVVVVVSVVVVLLRIRHKKGSNEEHESIDLEQNDFESMNSFSGGLSVSHVEEDPFANDFKEEKFIDQM